MKIPVFALAALLLGITALQVQSAPADANLEDLEKFNKEKGVIDQWSADEKAEEAKRLEEVKKEVKKNNEAYEKGKSTFKMQLYDFSDESSEEILKTKGGLHPRSENGNMKQLVKPSKRSFGIIPQDKDKLNSPENLARIEEHNRQLDLEIRNIPTSYNSEVSDDLSSLKFVTTAKHQGTCGSCAAFAEAGLLETVMLKAGAKLAGLDLSEQYLVDCAYQQKDENGNTYQVNRCSGAAAGDYTRWFIKNSGGEGLHEGQYAYKSYDGALQACKARNMKKWTSGYKVSQSWSAYQPSVTRIKQYILKHGAVMSVVGAAANSFDDYKEGVWQEQNCASANYNHAVLIVGWGREKNTDYWLVKNSWGNAWGLQGFIKIKMGTCWIGAEAVWATAISTTGESDPAPPVEEKEHEAPALWCDVTGRINGRIPSDGKYRIQTDGFNDDCSKARLSKLAFCSASTQKCKPAVPGPTNGCRYIFGKPKSECPQSQEPKGCDLTSSYGQANVQNWRFVYWNGSGWVTVYANLKNGVCNKTCEELCGKSKCNSFDFY